MNKKIITFALTAISMTTCAYAQTSTNLTQASEGIASSIKKAVSSVESSLFTGAEIPNITCLGFSGEILQPASADNLTINFYPHPSTKIYYLKNGKKFEKATSDDFEGTIGIEVKSASSTETPNYIPLASFNSESEITSMQLVTDMFKDEGKWEIRPAYQTSTTSPDYYSLVKNMWDSTPLYLQHQADNTITLRTQQEEYAANTQWVKVGKCLYTDGVMKDLLGEDICYVSSKGYYTTTCDVYQNSQAENWYKLTGCYYDLGQEIGGTFLTQYDPEQDYIYLNIGHPDYCYIEAACTGNELIDMDRYQNDPYGRNSFGKIHFLNIGTYSPETLGFDESLGYVAGTLENGVITFAPNTMLVQKDDTSNLQIMDKDGFTKIEFLGESTSIPEETASIIDDDASALYYNLLGQPVSKSENGVIIKILNGKVIKVINQ